MLRNLHLMKIHLLWLRGTKFCRVASAGRILTALLLLMAVLFMVVMHAPKVQAPSTQELHAQSAEKRIRELEGILSGGLQMIEPVGSGMAYRYSVTKELVEEVRE